MHGPRKAQAKRKRIGFVGLGSMGLPMAEALAQSGHQLFVYNRTHTRAQPLHEAGGRLAATPAEAAREAGGVVSMLPVARAVEADCFGEADQMLGLPVGGGRASSSTISVALSERLAKERTARSQGYMAGPVFGGPEAAAAKQLWLLAA